jgi:hypothetical protein
MSLRLAWAKQQHLVSKQTNKEELAKDWLLYGRYQMANTQCALELIGER